MAAEKGLLTGEGRFEKVLRVLLPRSKHEKNPGKFSDIFGGFFHGKISPLVADFSHGCS
jgi:hypothetical protein